MGADRSPQITVIRLATSFPLSSRCMSPQQDPLILCSSHSSGTFFFCRCKVCNAIPKHAKIGFLNNFNIFVPSVLQQSGYYCPWLLWLLSRTRVFDVMKVAASGADEATATASATLVPWALLMKH